MHAGCGGHGAAADRCVQGRKHIFQLHVLDSLSDQRCSEKISEKIDEGKKNILSGERLCLLDLPANRRPHFFQSQVCPLVGPSVCILCCKECFEARSLSSFQSQVIWPS